jgi:hypothetical protein
MPNWFTHLWFVTVLPRWGLAAAYGLVTWHLIDRIAGTPSVAVATRPLHVNQIVSRDDLQTRETIALVGKYVQREVATGQPVTPSIVGADRVTPKIASAAAAVIVRLSSAELLSRDIQAGLPVSVTTKSDRLSGRVEKIDCDAQQCAIFVSIANPPRALDAQALAGADIQSDYPIVP